MLVIDPIAKQINLTRGDEASIEIAAQDEKGNDYIFGTDDVIRFKVLKAKDCSCVELQKDTKVEREGTSVIVTLTKDETKIGEIINKPVDYWYEVELNPETSPQTIIGYDLEGEKIFTLYPEGSDKK